MIFKFQASQDGLPTELFTTDDKKIHLFVKHALGKSQFPHEFFINTSKWGLDEDQKSFWKHE